MKSIPFAILSLLTLPLLAQDPGQKPATKPAPAIDTKPVAEAKADAAPKTLQLGSRANGEIVLHDIDGKPQKAHALMGTVTVVNFYSIQCPIQADWDERLAQIQKDYEGKGVVFLHIDSNHTEIGAEPQQADGDKKPYANIREHLQKKGLPFRVLVDHGNVVADAFEAKTTPHVYVFGKDGKLVYKGLVDDDQKGKNADKRTNYLRDTLDKVLKGDKVEPFATQEVGCSIKRTKRAAPMDKAEKADKKGGEGKKGGE